jgi:uncharacterized protein YcgL (UPF0745 family)
MNEENLPCWVYRSPHHHETYLYLAREDGFDAVPEGLRDHFGEPVLVIELELSPDRALAREDILMVMSNLRTQGYHLQLPPELKPNLYHGNAD